jgi:PBP1b-binding outer membrane lipoprotein LpoB
VFFVSDPVFDVSFLRMVIIHAILVIIFLFGSCFAQSDTAKSSNSLQAEATVEIQYDGEVGFDIILMTSYPASCSTSITSTSNTNTSITNTTLVVSSLSTTPISTSSTSSTSFNTPPIFGTSQTQMINATSTGQYRFQTATDAS